MNVAFLLVFVLSFCGGRVININQGERLIVEVVPPHVTIKLHPTEELNVLQVIGGIANLSFVSNVTSEPVGNITTKHFIVPRKDAKHPLPGFPEYATLSHTFRACTQEKVNITLYFDELITIKDARYSKLIKNRKVQFIRYQYRRASSYGRKSNAFQISIISYSLHQLILDVSSRGGWLDNPEFGNVDFLVPRNEERILTHEAGSVVEQDYYFQFTILNDFEESSYPTDEYTYTVRAYPFFYFNLLIFFSLFLFVFSAVFITFLCCLACVRFCFTSCRRYVWFARLRNAEMMSMRDRIQNNNNGEEEGVRVELPLPDAEEYNKRRKSIPEIETCCVCMDHRKIVKFEPCGHICCCRFCASAVQKSSGLCPLCREKIKELHEVSVEEVKNLEADSTQRRMTNEMNVIENLPIEPSVHNRTEVNITEIELEDIQRPQPQPQQQQEEEEGEEEENIQEAGDNNTSTTNDGRSFEFNRPTMIVMRDEGENEPTNDNQNEINDPLL